MTENSAPGTESLLEKQPQGRKKSKSSSGKELVPVNESTSLKKSSIFDLQKVPPLTGLLHAAGRKKHIGRGR